MFSGIYPWLQFPLQHHWGHTNNGWFQRERYIMVTIGQLPDEQTSQAPCTPTLWWWWTRTAPQGYRPTSSPDLTITKTHLRLNARWEPKTTLNYDHFPITIDDWFAESPKSGPSCYTNYRKANWSLYTEETKQAFSNLPAPTSCATGKKILHRVLLKASGWNILRDKIPQFTSGPVHQESHSRARQHPGNLPRRVKRSLSWMKIFSVI